MKKTYLTVEQRRWLRAALGKDPHEAEARLSRRGEQASPWPLEALPKPGEEVRFGGVRFINPLSESGYRMAMDLREAALAGDNFRAMMRSIRDAGYDVLPQIRQEEDGSHTYSGMRFTKDGQHLSASQASLMIRPTPGQDRAPVLAEDGAWLLEMRKDYLARHRDMLLAQSRMRVEVTEIVEGARTGPEAAQRLDEAGFTTALAGEDGSLMRSSATFFRDGIGVEISWKAGRGVMRAARFLSRLERAPGEQPEGASPEP
ncbi:hypothetical protein [Paracoccus sp. ME4]|uniref:hypothetical protein n=1 Tax=Paracoccus sp. ME4 TaxID=3138066 RepID=UPI00398B65CF